MRIIRNRMVGIEEEVTFEKFARVPSWLFWECRCDKCGRLFQSDYVSLHPVVPPEETITVAISRGQRFVFHNSCFEE